MSNSQRFFICKKCGNMVGRLNDLKGQMMCCGENMTELAPNTVDAAVEKHLPVATLSGGSLLVQIGSAAHPMEEQHHIAFVFVETKNGGQRKFLNVGAEPKLSFSFANDQPLAVYAYCNLHGLWKTEI